VVQQQSVGESYSELRPGGLCKDVLGVVVQRCEIVSVIAERAMQGNTAVPLRQQLFTVQNELPPDYA
jgi:hypothetical protein